MTPELITDLKQLREHLEALKLNENYFEEIKNGAESNKKIVIKSLNELKEKLESIEGDNVEKDEAEIIKQVDELFEPIKFEADNEEITRIKQSSGVIDDLIQ